MKKTQYSISLFSKIHNQKLQIQYIHWFMPTQYIYISLVIVLRTSLLQAVLKHRTKWQHLSQRTKNLMKQETINRYRLIGEHKETVRLYWSDG